jgi:hypothetical protein
MRLIASLLLCSFALAAQGIWPGQWREHKRRKAEPVAITEKNLWSEYAGEASERAVYDGPAGRFAATAWRLKDATSALAWYQFMRPANATPVRGATLSATTPGTQIVAHQNYVLLFEGWRPLAREMEELYKILPQMRSGGGLPVLASRLPEKSLVRNSERYVLGLNSLALFEPRISPALAGFEDDAEAQLARYRTAAGEVALALFEYPTPQVARRKAAEFEKQPGWTIKRSGPLVAVIPAPADAAAAAEILNGIEWRPEFTVNEATKPGPMPDTLKMVWAAIQLAGVVLLFTLGGGILFATVGVWLRRRRVGPDEIDEPMITLNLGR